MTDKTAILVSSLGGQRLGLGKLSPLTHINFQVNLYMNKLGLMQIDVGKNEEF